MAPDDAQTPTNAEDFPLLQVRLTNASVAAVQEIEKRSADSRTDFVNRAIQVYAIAVTLAHETDDILRPTAWLRDEGPNDLRITAHRSGYGL